MAEARSAHGSPEFARQSLLRTWFQPMTVAGWVISGSPMRLSKFPIADRKRGGLSSVGARRNPKPRVCLLRWAPAVHGPPLSGDLLDRYFNALDSKARPVSWRTTLEGRFSPPAQRPFYSKEWLEYRSQLMPRRIRFRSKSPKELPRANRSILRVRSTATCCFCSRYFL